MSRKKNITDRAFRESLKQYNETPPEGVWTGISDSLEQDRRKSRMAWIGRIAASAALVIATGSVWVIIQRSPDSEIGRQESPEPRSEQQVLRESSTERQDLSYPLQDEQEVPATYQVQQFAGSDAVELKKTTELSGVREADRELQDQVQDEIAGHMIINTDIYTIPVDAPEPSLILAKRSRVTVSLPDEEGIDVFEEFGDEGYTDYDKWAVGGQVAPIYSYRNLGSSGADALYATSYLNDIESGIVSYAGGVNLNYSPARRLSVQSGLNYFRLGMSVKNTYIASVNDRVYNLGFPPMEQSMSNSSGDIQLGGQKANSILSNLTSAKESFTNVTGMDASNDQSAIQEGDLHQNFEYIEVPVILRYRVVDRRAGLSFLGGLSTNFLVGNNVYFRENGSREYIGTTENLKPVNYSSVLGVGFQYSINPNLHFNMEPTFRYYLNSINSISGPGSHPYSLGFFTGISYSF